MCKCVSKVIQKIFATLFLVIVLGIGIWVCFDVYSTSDNFVYDKFNTNYPQNVT